MKFCLGMRVRCWVFCLMVKFCSIYMCVIMKDKNVVNYVGYVFIDRVLEINLCFVVVYVVVFFF